MRILDLQIGSRSVPIALNEATVVAPASFAIVYFLTEAARKLRHIA
jgi:hypothetical protein